MTDQTTEGGEIDLSGRRWALHVAGGVMALTLLPYLFGWMLQGSNPSRAWYSWLGYNLDDSCVYLSWMRQAADGSFFQRNLFTTEPQLGHQFSVFFLALGNIARFLHLPLLLVYHAARLGLGIAFLRAVWWLLELLLTSPGARRAAFLTICFSAGLGWLPGLWRLSGQQSPADVWQPEAITFLCLYLSPLFLVSLLLMVGVIGWLVTAERTRTWKHVVYAGLCGLLLGNIHTYDVVTLCVVWTGYLAGRALVEKKIDPLAWGQAAVAGLMTAVSTGHMFYLVSTEDVFAKRVAVETLSPDFRLYLWTYGPLILLSLAGLLATRRKGDRRERVASDHRALILLTTWAVLNLVVAYLPVSFNRKMLMGEHIPLSILAGIGLYHSREALARWWWLLVGGAVVLPIALLFWRMPTLVFAGVIAAAVAGAAAYAGIRKRSPGGKVQAGLAGALGLLALTNVHFAARDMQNFQNNRAQTLFQRPYLFAGEVKALEWLRKNAPRGTAIQPLPWVQPTPEGKIAPVDTTVAVLAPGLSGLPVHAGHWGETPKFGETIKRWLRFVLPSTPEEERLGLLRESGVRYVLFTQKRDSSTEGVDPALLSLFIQSPPPYLRLVPEASNEDADVYEVRL